MTLTPDFTNVIKMYDDEDNETLENIRKFSARKKKSFQAVLNSKNMSEEDLDEFFFTY